MASSIFPPPPHQYYSDNIFSSSTDDDELICSQETSMFNRPNDVVPWLLNYDIINYSFPDQQQQQQFADNNCMVVPQMSEIVSDFSVSDYQGTTFEAAGDHHQDYYCSTTGLMVPTFCQTSSNYNPILPPHHQHNWGINRELGKSSSAVTKQQLVEEEVKVGRYSAEERKDRILRYLKKRNHRNFNKTIKYACRKTLADKRVRVRGRFAKNNEELEEVAATAHHHHQQQNNSFNYTDLLQDSSNFQMKCEEEDYWLQAAVDNLVHLPYL